MYPAGASSGFRPIAQYPAQMQVRPRRCWCDVKEAEKPCAGRRITYRPAIQKSVQRKGRGNKRLAASAVAPAGDVRQQ